jgi:uncharacterized protein (DUF433 family)
MIECNINKCFGQPSLSGRRLTVYDIVTKLYYERSIEIALLDYDISLEDAKEALNYCFRMRCQTEKNSVNFCDGCILRTIQEGKVFPDKKFSEFMINKEIVTVDKDRLMFFLGEKDELENDLFGKVTWMIAEEVLKKLD